MIFFCCINVLVLVQSVEELNRANRGLLLLPDPPLVLVAESCVFVRSALRRVPSVLHHMFALSNDGCRLFRIPIVPHVKCAACRLGRISIGPRVKCAACHKSIGPHVDWAACRMSNCVTRRLQRTSTMPRFDCASSYRLPIVPHGLERHADCSACTLCRILVVCTACRWCREWTARPRRR